MKYSLVILALITAWHAYAITLSPAELDLRISPRSLRAGSAFLVEAKSFVFDPTRARFQWFLDGKPVESGVGLREREFTAGELGSSMQIRVLATSNEGFAFEARTTIHIADIDFIIHPLTYTPSFYRGAALATPGSVVEIFALPHLFRNGARINPQNLIYEWSVDNKPLANLSGGGKNMLTLELADVGASSYRIGLKASSLDGGVSAEENVELKVVAPEAVFYQTSSLTGVRQLALSNFLGAAGQIFSIIAEPYFFGLDSLARAKTEWVANGEVLQPDFINPRLLELNAPGGVESESVFSFKIEDKETIFQRAEGSISVTASP